MKCFSKCMCFLSGTRISKGGAGRREMTPGTGGERRVSMAGGAWESSVDCSNDRRSAGHKKGQCFEDYHQILGLR